MRSLLFIKNRFLVTFTRILTLKRRHLANLIVSIEAISCGIFHCEKLHAILETNGRRKLAVSDDNWDHHVFPY